MCMHADGIRIKIYYFVIFVFPLLWDRCSDPDNDPIFAWVSRITCSAAGVSQAKVFNNSDMLLPLSLSRSLLGCYPPQLNMSN